MSYTGIGATDPNHPLEVEGQVFISNVETGNATQEVPFEVFSDYTGKAALTDSRQLRLRVTPSGSTTSNVHIDMGINNTDGDYFFISEPVVDATTAGTKSTFTINQAGNVGVGSNINVTGNVVTSNIINDTSPLTISTASNVQILNSNVGIGAVPFSNTRVHITGGSTASITNSNTFPKFIFSRNANASLKHGGGAHGYVGHVLFPSEDGKAWAVGRNEEGVLGLGLDPNTDVNKYTLVSALDGVANIVASSTTGGSGYNRQGTILLDDTGNVWACGRNANGQLGQGDTKQRNVPTLVSNSNIYNLSITEAASVGSGYLVLDSTGQIWGAGYNVDYRLGNLSGLTGDTNTTFIPSMPAGTHTFTSVDGLPNAGLALEDNGRIWSTGANQNGQTGQGTAAGTTAGWTEVDNTGGINDVSITQIVGGSFYSLALDSTGNVWGTGFNYQGGLGLGDTTDRNYFERVTTNVNVASGVTITKIAAGVDRSYLLDTAGRMWFAGYNVNGEAGQPPYRDLITTFFRTDAGPIADKSVTDFALSGYGSPIVRTSDNEYWVTGYGGDSTLGTGDNTNRYTFVNLMDVNANPPKDYGYTRSLLLENTETGKGPSIELKNKNSISSRIQMEDGVSGKMNIGFVDASFDPKFSGGDGAVLEPFQERTQSNTMTRGVTINQSGGTMVAGGETANVGFNTPVLSSGVPGSANYGYGGGCWGLPSTNFITTEGKVYFAGDNPEGQAGDGTTATKAGWIESTPPSSYPIVAWAGGTTHAMALDSNGQLWAAGRNEAGQLGLGDTTDRTTWTAVSGTRNQAIACGGATSYRLKSDGTIEACGYGGDYRLGNNNPANQLSFVASTSGALGSSKVKSVWAATAGAFVIRSDNVLLAVGTNGNGEAGVGSATNPVQTWTACDTTNFSGETPVQISTGFTGSNFHSMMITASGKIYGTGSGSYYRTGLNINTDVNLFTQCTGDIRNVTVTRVSTCELASIALDSTGNVWITGAADVNGQLSESDSTQFTKVTLPAEFYSKTIVNVFGGTANTFYAVDSEGTLWGVGQRIRGLGLSGADGYNTKLFSKVPIYDVVPKAFQYTPTLTLENPNPDYGATIEFKNPNNRAFINLDDQTSRLRLGFVDNDNNVGEFKGIQIAADGSLEGSVGIGTGNPQQKLEVWGNILVGRNNIHSFIHGGNAIAVSSDDDVLIVADANDLSGAAAGDIIFGYGSAINTDSNRDFTFAEAYPNGVPRVEVMRINTGTNSVGIGTTNPESNLHSFSSINSGMGTILYTQRADSSAYYSFFKQRALDFSTNPIFHFKTREFLENAADTYSTFRVEGAQGTSFLEIQQNGKVGIGITNPTGKLDVYENSTNTLLRLSSGDAVLYFFAENTVYGRETMTLQTTIDNRERGNYNSPERHILCLQPYAGRVGIGTTNPNSQLHLYSAYPSLNIESTASYAIMEMVGSSGSYIDMRKSTTADFNFRAITTGIGATFYTKGGPLRIETTADDTQYGVGPITYGARQGYNNTNYGLAGSLRQKVICYFVSQNTTTVTYFNLNFTSMPQAVGLLIFNGYGYQDASDTKGWIYNIVTAKNKLLLDSISSSSGNSGFVPVWTLSRSGNTIKIGLRSSTTLYGNHFGSFTYEILTTSGGYVSEITVG